MQIIRDEARDWAFGTPLSAILKSLCPGFLNILLRTNENPKPAVDGSLKKDLGLMAAPLLPDVFDSLFF